MKAVVQRQAGEPVDALELVDVPENRTLGERQVLIDVRLSRIKFGDMHLIRSHVINSLTNVYRSMGIEAEERNAIAKDKPAEVPLRRGSESYGIVAAVGPNVPDSIRVGGRVSTIFAQGTWAESVIAPANCVFPIPDALPDETAAQLFVVTLTALAIYRDLRQAVPDEALRQGTVILTAAGAAVARMLARFMIDDGLSVIGLTRSSDGASRAGALVPDMTFVSTSSPDWKDGVRAAAAGRPILAAADCVAGAFVGEVAELLQDDSVIFIYGGLSSEPLGLTGLRISGRGLQIRGASIRRWVKATEEAKQADVAAAIDLALRHPEIFPVAALVPLENFKEAVALVERPGRDGAVIIKI